MVIGGKFTSRGGPAWLPPLLEIDNFFAHCNHHTTGKNERNHFCFDCSCGPICPEGLSSSHMGHATIQIRRASHRDVVRIADIQKHVDLANIQPYTINGAKIVFLQSRPQPKMVKGASHYCEACHRSIVDPVRFCSILCKLTAIQEHPHDFTLMLTAVGKPGKGDINSKGASPAASTVSHGSGVTDFMPPTPKKASKRASNVETRVSSSKKAKRALVTTEALEDALGLSLPSLSPMAPSTPIADAGPRFWHRKQMHPQRAPMY